MNSNELVTLNSYKDYVETIKSIPIPQDKSYMVNDYIKRRYLKFDSLQYEINFWIKLFTRWNELLGDKEHLYVGKHIGLDLNFDSGLYMYLYDDDMENDIYYYIMDSHSGINEWIYDTFPKLISPLFGESCYDHAFGSYDFEYCLKVLHNPLRELKEKYSGTLFEDDVNSKCEHCLKIIDYLFYMFTDNENKEVLNIFDELFEKYIKEVITLQKEREGEC